MNLYIWSWAFFFFSFLYLYENNIQIWKEMSIIYQGLFNVPKIVTAT